MTEFEQALHRQGMDTAIIPSAWHTMQHLQARVEQHAEAIVCDFIATLRELETHRQQAGLKKIFLERPLVCWCSAARTNAARATEARAAHRRYRAGCQIRTPCAIV
jgi:hypothetical protein